MSSLKNKTLIIKIDLINQLKIFNPASKAGLLLGSLLALLAIVIAVLSYQPGTYLSGWDTLHPEFNFPLAFERQIFGVFRGEQGLGAVAAHAHMADLPRVFILSLASLVLPVSILRYLFISLCLTVGVLGCFVFIKRIIFKDFKYGGVFAFLGGLFYLLNLGTLQHFYVPFEMFTVEYALLPWLFYLATAFLENPSKKLLLFFAIATFFATPMAFASTLWFAFFLSFSLNLAFWIKNNFRQVLILIWVTLAINSFWLLPNFYFAFSGNASFVTEARINKIFSQEAFAYNQNYGTIVDTLIFRNFLFGWSVYDSRGHFTYLLGNWRQHLENPYVLATGFGMSAMALLGLVTSILARNRLILALGLPSLVSVIFLINQNPPFDNLFAFLRDDVPLFKEALRFPFTKFSIFLIFAFACFFALGQKGIFGLFSKFLFGKKLQVAIFAQVAICTVLLGIYAKPAFEGDFISSKIQVSIPDEYFEVFDWFNLQPGEGRVATFPIHTLWGWIYYDWGFQGAQFISFGIKQPVLDRDYDRWNSANEEYFRQMSYTIYAQNLSLFEKLLEKYQIKYLLVDETVISPDSPGDNSILYLNQIKSLINSSKKVKLAKKSGNLSVYAYEGNAQASLFTPKKFVAVTGPKGPKDIDYSYLDYGDYLNFEKNKTNFLKPVFYPYRSLYDNQNLDSNNTFGLSDQGIKIAASDLAVTANFSLTNYLKNEAFVPADLYIEKEGGDFQMRLNLQFPKVGSLNSPLGFNYQLPIPDLSLKDYFLTIDTRQIIKLDDLEGSSVASSRTFLSNIAPNNLTLYKISPEDSKPFMAKFLPSVFQVTLCGPPLAGQFFSQDFSNQSQIKLTAKNATVCLKAPFAKLFATDTLVSGGLVKVAFNTNSATGNKGRYCIFDSSLNRCLKEGSTIAPGSLTENYLLLGSSDLGRLEMIFYLDNENRSKVGEIEYSDLSLAAALPKSFFTVLPQEIRQVVGGQNFVLAKNEPLLLGYQKQGSSVDFSILDTATTTQACKGVTPKRSIRQLVKDRYVEYRALQGSTCDYFSFPDIPHNVGTLMVIENQNVAGLPLRICAANDQTRRCDAYLSLPKNKDFTQNVIVIPPAADGGSGFDIHIDNYSAGSIESINRVKSLKVFQFPYQWLSSLNFGAGDASIYQNNLQIQNVRQLLPFVFQADFKPGDQKGLVVLNKSFEAGWVSLGAEHVKVNDWANGFLVKSDGSLTVFYWPQLLEFLGFGLVAASFVWILKRHYE